MRGKKDNNPERMLPLRPRLEKAGSKTEAIDLLRGNGGGEASNQDRTTGGGVDTAEEDVKTI